MANDKSFAFEGIYDGNGHSVSGLYKNGLFEYIGEEGVLKNLVITNSYFFGDLYDDIAGICIYNYGLIKNCINKCDSMGGYAAGICYYNTGKIINCLNKANIGKYVMGSYSGNEVAGICMRNFGYIGDCINTGSVAGLNPSGICMFNFKDGVVNNCFNSGIMTGYGNGKGGIYGLGGICGFVGEGGSVSNCINVGYVTETAVSGSVVGKLFASALADSIKNCFGDKQMCPVPFIRLRIFDSIYVEEISKKVLLTKDLVGQCQNNLPGFDTSSWTFTEGFYPIPSGFDINDEIVRAAATPIFLYVNPTDNDDYETVDSVAHDFRYTNYEGAEWSEVNDSISFADGKAKLLGVGLDTVVLKYGAGYKIITLNVKDTQGDPSNVEAVENEIVTLPYPNPTVDGFFVEAGEKERQISIFNLEGQLLQKRTVKGNSYIDLTGYASGLYLVDLDGEKFKVEKR